MKITIVSDDKSVGKDGEFYADLDFQLVPEDVHALQWDGTSGTLEFKSIAVNEQITTAPVWLSGLLAQWSVKHQIFVAEVKAREDAAADNARQLKESIDRQKLLSSQSAASQGVVNGA